MARKRLSDVEARAYVATSSPPPVRYRNRVSSAAGVAILCEDIAKADQEHFVVFDLDTRHNVIARRVVGIGSVNGVEAHPRETFRQAIVNNAAAIIVAHNHPSGDSSPSKADIVLTERLIATGELIGIPVLDHIIVSADGFTSLLDISSRMWSAQ